MNEAKKKELFIEVRNLCIILIASLIVGLLTYKLYLYNTEKAENNYYTHRERTLNELKMLIYKVYFKPVSHTEQIQKNILVLSARENKEFICRPQSDKNIYAKILATKLANSYNHYLHIYYPEYVTNPPITSELINLYYNRIKEINGFEIEDLVFDEKVLYQLLSFGGECDKYNT